MFWDRASDSYFATDLESEVIQASFIESYGWGIQLAAHPRFLAENCLPS